MGKCVYCEYRYNINTNCFFLIYINYLFDLSKILDFILFADDNNIFSSHKNVYSLEKTLNEELLKLTTWCQANKLSINYSKSKFMVFKVRQKRQNLDIKLEISNCAIERVRDTMFLGVFILDENLTWKHIAMLQGKFLNQLE